MLLLNPIELRETTLTQEKRGSALWLLLCVVRKGKAGELYPWTAAHQAPPSMGFSRQEYWSGLPFSSPYYYLRSREREQKLKEDVGNRKGYVKIHLNTEGDGCAGKKN